MPRLTYIASDGGIREVDAAPGMTVMRAAIMHDVPGIDAECGGACACGTCHVIVDAAWAARLPPPEPMELDTLDLVTDIQPDSRLSCQVVVTAALDGLVVHTPARQG